MFGSTRKDENGRRGTGIFGAMRSGQARNDSQRLDGVGAERSASAEIAAASIPREAMPPVSRLLALEPEEHARELLAWLQAPGGRTGAIPARDLMAAYAEMTASCEIEPVSWHVVGRALRELIGDRQRRYVEVRRGKRVERLRTYHIPPAGLSAGSRASARWAGGAQTAAA